jgi:hypothetical protein
LFGDTQSGSDLELSLRAIAAPAREKKRMSPQRMRGFIRTLCNGRCPSAQELAALLRRDPRGLQDRYLTPMCGEGRLALHYPGKPNRPDQAYTSKGLPDAGDSVIRFPTVQTGAIPDCRDWKRPSLGRRGRLTVGPTVEGK